MTSSKNNGIIFALLTAHIAILFALIFFRILDYDEGFYLMAARNVAQGFALYSDFFYPQAPFLPYLLAPFSENGFATLYMSRAAGVAASIVGLFLFWFLVSRLTSDSRTKILILFLYCFSALTLFWHSAAKTYAWTDAFLLCGFVSLYQHNLKRGLGFAALAGIFLALAVNIRTTCAPILLLWGWHIWKLGQDEKKGSAIPLMTFFGCILIVSIPSLSLLFAESDRFLFDNFIFHTMRNPGVGFLQSLVDRTVIIAKLIVNPSILFPLLFCIFAFQQRKSDATIADDNKLYQIQKLAILTAIVITITYLLPNPIHQQYFVQAVPFALLGGCMMKRLPAFNRVLMVFLCVVYAGMLIPYWITFVGGKRNDDKKNNLSDIKAVTQFLNSNCSSDALIYSEVPIIPALSNGQTWPELAFVGFEYYLPLTDEQKRFYHLPVTTDLNQLIDKQVPAYCIVVNEPVPALRETMSQRYRETARFGCYLILARR